MPSKIVLTEPLPDAGMRVLRACKDAVIDVLPAPTEAALEAALPDAGAVIMVMEQPMLTARHIERAPQLKVACRFGAGFDNFDVPALTRRRIPLATAGNANADTVAEHALYLMLALAKRGPALDRAVKGGAWPRGFGSVELRDKTCLVVGYGRIGRQVARRAAAFDMRIVIADPHVPEDVIDRDGYTAAALESALPSADFVVLALALTPRTRGLMGAGALALMKPSAFLVNVARGPVVDQRALAAALSENRLRGAGLDVLETEPPDLADPLLSRDDVVLTPHTAAYIDTAFARMAIATAENALAGLAGTLDPENVVNREVLSLS